MERRLMTSIPTLLFCLGIAQAEDAMLQSKHRTDRAITIEVTVKASPEEVFRLWSTTDGVKRFVGPEARIGNGVGEAYTVMFDPKDDPEGLRLGTNGCRILSYEPGHFLAFEWKGTPDMPDVNARPYPTWVEIEMEPAKGLPGYTHVRFNHYGFDHSPSFDKGYEFFDRAWHAVMARFQGLLNGDPI